MCSTGKGKHIDTIRKKLFNLFASFELKITLETRLTAVQFLDVELDLHKKSFKPYRKPDDTPVYIHVDSNHPPQIKKQLPKMISQRLSTLSSSKQEFESSRAIYDSALRKSGYKETISFIPHKTEEEKNENKIAQGDNQIFSRTKASLAYTYAYSTQVQN